MASLSSAEHAAFRSPDFKIHARLLVDGVAVEDLLGGYNPLLSGSAQASLQKPVQEATFTCRLWNPERTRCLSPYLSSGVQLNGRPLFATGRRLMLQLQTPPAGTPASPGGWHNAFDGVIDDPDAAAEDSTAITLQCRDKFSRLLDRKIKTLTTTAQGLQWGHKQAGGPVWDVIRNLLTTWRPVDIFGNPLGSAFEYSLKVIDEGTLVVTDYWQERMSVLEAARRLALQDGRDLRGIWDGEDFILAYYKPRPTNAGFAINYSFAAGHDPTTALPYTKILKLGAPIGGVVNIVEVTPFHPTDPSVRVPQVVQDEASIEQYGERFAAISQDRSSGIDSVAKGSALAIDVLNQLKAPHRSIQLLCPFYWFVQLHDLFAVHPNGINYDLDLQYSVSAWSWEFDRGRGSATISGQPRGAAAQREWREVKDRLVYVSTGAPVGPGNEGDVWFQVDTLTLP